MSAAAIKGDRIAKVIAGAGLCSRREAETWIEQGRISVNGHIIDSPALNVTPDDRICIDGHQLPPVGGVRLWLYHKPRGLITTTKDPQNRPTVFENLPRHLPRVISVGRLDLTSEGLLLLTNSGNLSKFLSHPSSEFKRTYRVRVFGIVKAKVLDQASKGISIDGIHYASFKANIDKVQGDNTWVTLTLREGKNREIRKIMEFLGHPVNRLIRISFGPFELGNLKPWAVAEADDRLVTEIIEKMQRLDIRL